LPGARVWRLPMYPGYTRVGPTSGGPCGLSIDALRPVPGRARNGTVGYQNETRQRQSGSRSALPCSDKPAMRRARYTPPRTSRVPRSAHHRVFAPEDSGVATTAIPKEPDDVINHEFWNDLRGTSTPARFGPLHEQPNTARVGREVGIHASLVRRPSASADLPSAGGQLDSHDHLDQAPRTPRGTAAPRET